MSGGTLGPAADDAQDDEHAALALAMNTPPEPAPLLPDTKPKKMGRPSKKTPPVMDEIIERLADGESLRAITALDHMPVKTTVINWLNADRDFLVRYARAREAQADAIFDECLDIADDSTGDVSVDDKGKLVFNGEVVQRARLRVDTRLKLAGKLRPEKYGDRLDLQVSGALDVINMTDTKLNETIIGLMEKVGAKPDDIERLLVRTLPGQT